MQEARRHRLGRGARLALVGAGVGVAWAGAALLLGSTSGAQASDGLIPDVAGDAISTVQTVVDTVPLAPVVDQVVDLGGDVGAVVADTPVVGDVVSEIVDVVETVPPVVLSPVVDLPVAPPAIVAPVTVTTAPAAAQPPSAPRTLAGDLRISSHSSGAATTPAPAAAAVSTSEAVTAPAESPWAPLTPTAPAPVHSATTSSPVPAPVPADRSASPRTSFDLLLVVAHPDDAPLPGPARVIDSSPD